MRHVLQAITCCFLLWPPVCAAMPNAEAPNAEPEALTASMPWSSLTNLCSRQHCNTESRFAGYATTSGGAATYEIPLLVPHSVPEFLVRVVLSYSSRLGNGEAGMGWSLDAGNDSVYRCPPFVELDGYASQVHLSDADPVCWGGERLILVDGKYGKDGSEYVTEMDSGRLFQLHGDIDDADARFVARDSNGYQFFYGAQGMPGGTQVALYWHLMKQMSPKGKSIEYVYDSTDSGQTMLREIDYPGIADSNEKAAPANFVRFTYSPRDDVSSSYLAGGESRQNLILAGVTGGTKNADGTDRITNDYALEYSRSKSTGRMLLDRIRGCAQADQRTICLHPVDIQWLDQKIVYAPPQQLSPGQPKAALAGRWKPGDALPSLASWEVGDDYDGDGRRELFARGADGTTKVMFFDQHLRAVTVGAIPGSMTIRGERWPDIIGHDLRHVGGADLVGDVNGLLSISGWRHGRFTVPERTSIDYSGDAIVLDADGDGQPDLLIGRSANGNYVVTLYRNRGSSDKKLAFAAGEVVANVPDAPGLHLESCEKFVSTGRTALLRSDHRIEGAIEFRSSHERPVIVSLLKPSDMGISDEAQKQGVVFADINGDGLIDIVYVANGTWHVQINTDGRFAPAQNTAVADVRSTPVARSGTIVADVDSDGRDELLFPARRKVDYCVLDASSNPLCSDALGSIEPRMDLGIYEYDILDFRMDADGRLHPQVRSGSHLVAQANRASVGELHGDGYPEVVSPFDRGIANGAFKSAVGVLSDCPEGYGCGLRIAIQEHALNHDAQDNLLDVVKRVQRDAGLEHSWNYFPLSSGVRAVYAVPRLESHQRFISRQRTYFTSSMYVVGEDIERQFDWTHRLRYRYGGGSYDTQGRGFDGFRWIVTYDDDAGKKYGTWFRQSFPYRGRVEQSWTASVRNPDHDDDYLIGWPGKEFLGVDRIEIKCHGPVQSDVSRKFHCLPGKAPAFYVDAGEIPAAPPLPHRVRFDRIGIPDEARFAVERDFRARFPRPSNASQLKTIWDKATATTTRLSAEGSRADVDSLNGNWTHHGTDQFRFGANPAYQEIRDSFTSIAVGQNYCSRNDGETGWTCASGGGMIYGLADIAWNGLIGGSIAPVRCAQKHCVRIVLSMAKVRSADDSGKGHPMYSMAPRIEGSRIELVVALPDYKPLTMKQTDYRSRTLIDTATTVYHLDTPIDPITLP